MPPISPRRRHPEYEASSERTEFLWDSYQGGEDYSADKYLDKYPRERGDVYEERKNRAYLLNYVAAVVDAYTADVFKRDPIREVPDSFNDFLIDATGEGESLTDFIREAMTRALATLRTYVVVDINEEGYPYVHFLHPANLLDYSVNQDGTFAWALVAEKKVVEDDPFEGRSEVEQLRLWTPEAWYTFNDKGQPVDEGDNLAGEVPIVTVVPGNMPLPIYDIARINRRIYNLCSQLDEILINVTFPQMYTQAGEGVEDEAGEPIAPDVSPIVLGTSRVLLLPDEAKMAPGFLAPPDGPANVHIEERERLIDSIYSLAGLERKEARSLRAQSGTAKAYDFRETNARLASIAHASERVEEEILYLLSAYGFEGEFNVSYQKDFNVRDFALMLHDYMNISKTNLPPAAKRYAAKDVVTQIAEDASPEETKALQEAVENMDDSEFTNNAPLAGSVNGQPVEGEEDTASRAESILARMRGG